MGFRDNVQPPKRPEIITLSPLDDHPDHAAALGRLVGHWALLEFNLMAVLRLLLGVNQQKSKFIYQEFISATSKIKLLQRLNHHSNTDGSKKQKLKELLDRADKLNKHRNYFIHALWIGTDQPDFPLLRIKNSLPGDFKKPHNPPEAFSAQDIQDVVVKIAELSVSLQEWTNQEQAGKTTQP